MSKGTIGTTDVEVENETNRRADPQVSPRVSPQATVVAPPKAPPATEEPEEEEIELIKAPVKKCLFTGGHATRQKFIEGQIVYLCEDMYQTKTTGEIKAQLVKLSKGEEDATGQGISEETTEEA